jgi:hypothetical protein
MRKSYIVWNTERALAMNPNPMTYRHATRLADDAEDATGIPHVVLPAKLPAVPHGRVAAHG